jgi:hypothetical protein
VRISKFGLVVAIGGGVEAILGLSEGPIIAIPEILAGVEVVDAFAFGLLPVYVDVLLLDWGVEEGRGGFIFLPAGHVVSFEDASCPCVVVTVR